MADRLSLLQSRQVVTDQVNESKAEASDHRRLIRQLGQRSRRGDIRATQELITARQKATAAGVKPSGIPRYSENRQAAIERINQNMALSARARKEASGEGDPVPEITVPDSKPPLNEVAPTPVPTDPATPPPAAQPPAATAPTPPAGATPQVEPPAEVPTPEAEGAAAGADTATFTKDNLRGAPGPRPTGIFDRDAQGNRFQLVRMPDGRQIPESHAAADAAFGPVAPSSGKPVRLPDGRVVSEDSPEAQRHLTLKRWMEALNSGPSAQDILDRGAALKERSDSRPRTDQPWLDAVNRIEGAKQQSESVQEGTPFEKDYPYGGRFQVNESGGATWGRSFRTSPTPSDASTEELLMRSDRAKVGLPSKETKPTASTGPITAAKFLASRGSQSPGRFNILKGYI